MKKIYYSPASETVEIGFVSMICDVSPENDGLTGDPPPAPKPRPDKPF